MRLKGLLIAGMACTMAFGTAASAEAKPQDSKIKHCTKKDKKLRCETANGTVVSGVCPAGFEPARVIELGPGTEVFDLNDNAILCYNAQLTIDDTPAS
jgi:hypothetical protein